MWSDQLRVGKPEGAVLAASELPVAKGSGTTASESLPESEDEWIPIDHSRKMRARRTRPNSQ